jgi:hypothetical protein
LNESKLLYISQTRGIAFMQTRSQSYDFWIYSYNASGVGGYMQRFSKQKKMFLFLKRARLSVAL